MKWLEYLDIPPLEHKVPLLQHDNNLDHGHIRNDIVNDLLDSVLNNNNENEVQPGMDENEVNV